MGLETIWVGLVNFALGAGSSLQADTKENKAPKPTTQHILIIFSISDTLLPLFASLPAFLAGIFIVFGFNKHIGDGQTFHLNLIPVSLVFS